jgi:hypothetical protein
VGGYVRMWLLVLVAGCGRISFGLLGDHAGDDASVNHQDGADDGDVPGDGIHALSDADMDASPLTGGSDAMLDAAPPIYFFDDFADGNFTTSPAGVTDQACNVGNCGTLTATVVNDTDGAWLQVMRAGAPNDGGAYRVIYDGLATPVGSTIHLHYKMRLASEGLTTGGSFCAEFGSWVLVRLTLTDATQTSLDYVANSGTLGCTLQDATWHYQTVALNTWNTIDRDIAADLTAAGLPAAVQIDEVRVGGSGWNFEVHYDDVTITP